MDDDGMVNNSIESFTIPTHLTSDYIQIVYLILTFFIGCPLNLYTFVKLARQYYVTKSKILLLSLHLNISDLMILFFFAFPKICWLYTYRWLGGTLLCKMVKFAQVFSFALSSNVIVCIGLDRLISLLEPLQLRKSASTKCKRMLTMAWVLALVCSAPQIHIWLVFEPSPNWAQCVDMWTVWDYQNSASPTTDTVRLVYKIVHIMVIFWIPLCIILTCYTVILKIIYSKLGDDQQVQLIRNKSLSFNNHDSSNSSGRQNHECATNVTKINPLKIEPLRCQSLNNRYRFVQKSVFRRNVNQMRVRRTKYRTLKITVSIVTAYIVFWLPYNILAVWNIADIESYKIYVDRYLYIFYNLIAVNAVVNPVIYSRISFLLCRQTSPRSKANVRFVMDN